MVRGEILLYMSLGGMHLYCLYTSSVISKYIIIRLTGNHLANVKSQHQCCTVAAKLVNEPWCKKSRWAPYSHREKFH